MVKFPSLKCPLCSKKYNEVPAFGSHMRGEHPGTIPEDWSDLRYAYFIYTGRSHGRCRECGGDTPWNETTGSYAKICNSPACKKKYRDRFMASMRASHGKDNLLDDPKYRERMLTGRKISGTYAFQDGGEIAYMGKLEKAFLVMLDRFFGFPSCDIISPSPNRYIYHYTNPNDEEHEGEHTYVPDFYIPSCNLEIELKSSKNERPRNLMIDVPRDACKDLHMIKNPSINYVKVYEDDYHVFFQVFADLAMQNQTGDKRPIKYISRALLTSVYRDYIPDDILRVLDNYIYKYSDKSVTRKLKATEGTLPIIETPEEESTEPENTTDFTVINIDEYYADSIGAMDESEPEIAKESVGLELVPLSLNAFAEDVSQNAVLEDFAIEGFFGISSKDVDTGKIDGRAAVRYSRWRDRLFGGNLVGTTAAKAYVKVAIKDGILSIRGINCNLLLYRIKDTYAESRLKYIFQYAYNARSLKLYEKRRIGRGDMKIDYVYAPEFFALELIDLFRELGDLYHDNSYRRISEMIYEVSWLSRADKVQMPPMSTAPLKNLALELMPHQVSFIEQWPQLKAHLNLNGYILSFKPGKGKTLTAIGLAECLHTNKVYIVCPNNLKDNWALEIKKYYSKYSDEKLWEQDVCILGSKFGNPKTARFIIVNNESIKLMLAVAKTDPDAMLILDECHNFRNYNGGRTKDLFALADKIQSKNVLCVSATPIKASPAEITPALYLIDPTFNDEAAAMYAKCFDLSTTSAMGLINKRFGMIIYRPADVKVDLPPKNTLPFPLPVSNEERFYLSNVHDEIIADFQKRHNEWLKTCTPIVEDFRQSITKWALCDRKLTNGYLQWVIYSSNSLRNDGDFHELDIKDYKVFIETNVRMNSACPSTEVERLINIERELITAAKRHMGYAVGSILPPRRNELYIRLYDENREKFYEMIRNRGKKTVIFSTMVPVIKHIVKDLDAFGIGTVSITGETKNRLEVLNQFREDPNTLVLVATSWCMGIGVTLTEASQMFFFGTPWRSTDFEQACDRIWRIGQTEQCDIFTVMCQSKQKNLSDRMQDILEWSNQMFDTAITAAEVGDDVPPEAETALLGNESYHVINIDDAAMEALFRPTGQMLGGVKYSVKDGHVLCILSNCTREKFFSNASDFPPVAKFMKGFKSVMIVTINECIDIYNDDKAIGTKLKMYAGTGIAQFYQILHEKCRNCDPRMYAGKRILPELVKETLTEYTQKEPDELVILFLETAYNYVAFMEYPVLRLAVGTVPNTIWNIEDAIKEIERRGKAFAMSDPSLRGKGTMVDGKKLKLYHVSPHKFTELKPQPTRTPMFGENVVIERCSAGSDIEMCFKAIGLKNFTVYHIYELQITDKTRIMKPNVDAVPDAKESGEHWVLDAVKVKEIETRFVCADFIEAADKFRYTNALATTSHVNRPSEILKVSIDNCIPIEEGHVIFTLSTRSGEKIGSATMDFTCCELTDIEIAKKYQNQGYATTLIKYIADRSQRKIIARGALTPNDVYADYVSRILLKIFAPNTVAGAKEGAIPDEEFAYLTMTGLQPIKAALESYKDPANESANFSNTNKHPVFILLTVGHSPLSGIIRGATGDHFSHSSISLDISLDPMYSFGTKKLDGRNREMGFVKTDPYASIWGGDEIPVPYSLFVTYVDDENYMKIKNRLEYFVKNGDKFKYSFAGLARVFFHIKSPKRMHWFCSAFVAEVLGQGYALPRDSTLFRPENFMGLADVEHVISGANIIDYDVTAAKAALRKVEKLPQGLGNPLPFAMESAGIEPVMESERAWRNISGLLKTMQSILSGCKYGMLVNGKVEDPDDAYYDEYYRTASPGIFIKQKCGTCYDFAAYQDFFLKAHNIFCQNYFIELLVEPYMTHMFTIIERSDGLFVYPESAFEMIAGTYQAYTIDAIVSYILTNMARACGRMKPYGQHEFKVYRLKPNYSTFGESLAEFTDRVHKTAKELQIRYNPKMCYLQPFQGDTPVMESMINFNADGFQYEELSDDMVTVATKVYVNTEYLIHSLNSFPSDMMLPGSFPHYLQYIKRLRRVFGVDHNIATFVIAVRLTNLKNPDDKTLHHIAITVPFNDGAIIPEIGLTIECNGLYFAESLPNAVLGIAQKMGEAMYGRDFNITLGEFKIDAWVVMQDMIDKITSEVDNTAFGAWLDEIYATTDTVKLDKINPNWRELHKMEVLKHGWIAKRY